MSRRTCNSEMKTVARFRYFRFVLALVLMTAFLGCPGKKPKEKVWARASQKAPFGDKDIKKKSRKFPSDSVIHFEPSKRTIRLLKAKNLSEDLAEDERFRKLQSGDRFDEIALYFIDYYHESFRLEAPRDELTVKSVKSDGLETKHVRFLQKFQDIPVWGCEITVHLNSENSVYMVQGQYIPTPEGMNTTPILDSESALRTVAQDLGKGRCPFCRPDSIILPVESGDPKLAWLVLATVSLGEGWSYFIDARNGDILKKLSSIRSPK